MSSRTEKDLIGKLEVPQNALYGIHTQRAVDNFKISGSKIGESHTFVKSLVMVKKACAMANRDLETIPVEKADLIIVACDQILNNVKDYTDAFPSDVYQGGAGTSVNMNTNEVIANVALDMNDIELGQYQHLHPNDHVNKSQSTNDAYPTAFRVALHYYVEMLCERLEYLIADLKQKATEFSDVIKMGRTQLQDAVPMSLGDEFNAWAVNLSEEIKNLRRNRDLIHEVNLGATAIGTGVNAHQEFSVVAISHLCDITGQPFVRSENLIEATSDCGAYVSISSALKRTAVKLSKISNDLRLLSSGPRCGIKEINLPEMQAGSSIMPAKVNPVIPEVVNQVCFKVIGNDQTVTLAAEAGQLQLNVMEPVIAQCLFEDFHLLANAITTLSDKCIKGITANPEKTRAMVENSAALVVFLNPYLGHEAGDELGKESISTGKSIRSLVLEKELMTEEQLDKILTDSNLIHPQYRV